MLDKLLEYHEQPESYEFVDTVMQGVAREQKIRKLILSLTGILGAAFGLLGVYWLAGPLMPMFSQLMTAENASGVGLLVLAALGLVAWMLHDETGLAG